jgi:hypothetical protein
MNLLNKTSSMDKSGFDDLLSNNNSYVFAKPLISIRFINNPNGAGVQMGNNKNEWNFKLKG